MSISSSESRVQRWRAIAELANSPPALITLAHNVGQIHEIIEDAYFDVLPEEVRNMAKKIHIERFEGIATKGYWKHYETRSVPKR